MPEAHTSFLVLNGGSSSIKFAVFRGKGVLSRLASGSVERIGLPRPVFFESSLPAPRRVARPVAAPDHAAAAALLVEWARRHQRNGHLTAIGHRIVHGGPDHSHPQRVSSELLADLKAMQSFDPQHLPHEILLMEAFRSAFPEVPQVACFDTAFHHDMPRVAQMLPIPRHYEASGVRRYGFHGLSYQFLMAELARLAGAEAAMGRIILAHLGNGASLAAVKGGRPMDTSMGFTPASGIMMGTRSGDIDPGLVSFLARTQNMDAAGFDEMVNFKSGLAGISETSSDMADLLACQATDPRAAEAVDLFCYQVKKYIGALAAVLGGVDQLVFAGGVGEHSDYVRARVCDGLAFLGIGLDRELNAAHAPLISRSGGPVSVRVLHTDEELMIATAMDQILSRNNT